MRGVIFAVLAALITSSSVFAALESRQGKKHAEALKYATQAVEKMNEKDWAGAIDLFTQALDMKALDEKGTAASRSNRGTAYQRSRQCEKAIPDFDAALSVMIDDPNIYFGRGLCESELKNTEKALADVGKAIELKPDEVSYRRVRCLILYNDKKIEQAMPDCEIALASVPGDTLMLEAIGTGSETLKQFDRARKAYQQLLALNSESRVAIDGLKRIGNK